MAANHVVVLKMELNAGVWGMYSSWNLQEHFDTFVISWYEIFIRKLTAKPSKLNCKIVNGQKKT